MCVTAEQMRRLQGQGDRGPPAGARSRPQEKEIEQVTVLARVMYEAVLGLHYLRREQKHSGQLAIY